ncbi:MULTISPECIES: MarR family winged helix-turn-helix transcriptional regulator [Rhizobiaceae]|jgi:DNA-binding MarR family transcriptional regulator|uniref:MarR family transcriptional regulator n=1 Tax=Peteryoungia algae TaxID=2919917 RepID=A0ABT0D4Q3_9HYPH|nr:MULTISPECIES: MarR family transcriptional regulator [unclassified Rhizobium]MCC8934589.1 MarR family transcriptional regulator [Rhizobium sp. 'Codium 1']MCJ8240387.1 MarR family transcriptional regulator [Rhizobium sp. SSM4.3]
MTDETLEKELRLDKQLCFALYGAAHAFTRAYKPLLTPLGLTYPQYVVMMALWEEDDLSVKALGEKVGLDSGTLSPLLKRLEQIQYVSRRRDAADERVVFITLTEEGRALKRRALEVFSTIGNQTGCDIAEIESLRDSLNRLKDQLETVHER